VVGRGDEERAGLERGGGKARSRSRGGAADAPMGEAGEGKRVRSNSVPRDRSMTRRDSASIARSQSPARTGLRDPTQMKKGEKLRKKSQFQLSKMGRIESDRRIPSEMPKHLNSGKRGMGKTDRR
jgi:hypothetical protein